MLGSFQDLLAQKPPQKLLFYGETAEEVCPTHVASRSEALEQAA